MPGTCCFEILFILISDHYFFVVFDRLMHFKALATCFVCLYVACDGVEKLICQSSVIIWSQSFVARL